MTEANTEEKVRKVELKVCERCGGLWLRPEKSRWIYCGPCKTKVDELPAPQLKPSGKKPQVKVYRKERAQ